MVLIAYAAGYNIKSLLAKIIIVFVNPFVIFLAALATLLFFWGLFKFLSKADSEDARATGKRHMLNGLWGLFVMLAFGAFMNLMVGTFDLKKPPENIKLNDPSSVENEGRPYDFQKK